MLFVPPVIHVAVKVSRTNAKHVYKIFNKFYETSNKNIKVSFYTLHTEAWLGLIKHRTCGRAVAYKMLLLTFLLFS